MMNFIPSFLVETERKWIAAANLILLLITKNGADLAVNCIVSLKNTPYCFSDRV